jgi:hypothetical protein
MQRVHLFSEKTSQRLHYIGKTLLTEALGFSIQLHLREDTFQQADGIKINYSAHKLEGSIQIIPHALLFDHGIHDYPISVLSHPAYHKIFMANGGKEVPFDLFAAAFWLLSRYEEHLPHKGDIYNRFNYRSSLAYQNNFLTIPLINLWLEQFKKVLSTQQPDVVFKKHSYTFLSTIDIDNAYQYKYKGFVRTVAGMVSDRSLAKIKERTKIILGLKPDPFDCYDFLLDTHRTHGIQALFFILLGDYGPNDKNHSASDLRFHKLIKHIKDYAMVGIHPSFGSNKTIHQLQVEVHRLSSITHFPTSQSRQHFSMLSFPDTYQHLLQAGITADYSMGYTNHNGFRASYCFPFKWYSLENESITPLLIHPFCLSENTLLSHTQNRNEMLLEAKLAVDEVKKYHGTCISIFHNDNFDKDLHQFYTDFVTMAVRAD